ncbi:FRG domain-containing protein [Marinobacter daepoensis]|uniref:FRG domain-containing protein n=1 Tax=Marinobacter daepoensis TaxID=262077 RepID=UPI001C97780D|nr:FRG domain-containing protein [Marinobacter daepoensis]MBY6033309.1 FRG domain-containing protein [Marinobacter daepoensis]
MYNLLVTARRGAWDQPFYEFDKSRFLEYTAESVSEAFKSLTPSLIDLLKSYPCIFAYEGDDQDIRIGNLTSIKERGRKLLIEFEFDQDIPPIPFSDIEPIAPLLDIRDWEINRTHWAVKDEDLFGRLLTAGLLSDVKIKAPEKQEKPPTKRSTAPKVSTVQGFIGKVLSSERDGDLEVFYRGHSNKNKYKLEPSLFRKDDDGNYFYLENEHILYRELLVSNSADFQSDVYTLDKLVRMQHYSLPTRLLDITSNPLIALYFACKSAPHEDGEVITFTMPRTEVKYFDSDVASCISNLARLPKGEKDKISFEIDDFNGQNSVKRLIHFIKEEKPYFEPKIVPDDLRKIVCVKGKQSNDRISSQSGAFLLYGLDAVMDEEGTPDISVTRITVDNKGKILKELDLLNINESTVFPYIENSAKYVAEKYKFNKTLQRTSR